MTFKEGDLAWIKLTEKFLVGIFGKLRLRANCPFKIVKWIFNNAIKVDLLGLILILG